MTENTPLYANSQNEKRKSFLTHHYRIHKPKRFDLRVSHIKVQYCDIILKKSLLLHYKSLMRVES